MNKFTRLLDKLIFAAFLTALFCGVVVNTSYEIKAKPTDEAPASETRDSNKSTGSEDVSDIMNGYDFLNESEKPADFENIKQYLEDFKAGKLNFENESEDSKDNDKQDQSLSDDTSEAENIDSDESVIKFDPNDWKLILVNKQNYIPEDYEPDLAAINGSLQADRRIIGDIYDMLNAASKDGVNLMICSAYRSKDRQTSLFNNKMNKLLGKKMSYLEAYKEGSMSVTPPGTSEHQLGLALDILTGSYTAMDDGFADTQAGKWLAINAPKYGFILRYPKGKEKITGIIYEPWHFRYVGKEYAEELTSRGICLEELISGDY